LVADAGAIGSNAKTGTNTWLRPVIPALEAAIVGPLIVGPLRFCTSTRVFPPRIAARVSLAQQAGIGCGRPLNLLGYAAPRRLTFQLALNGRRSVSALGPALPAPKGWLVAFAFLALRSLNLARLLCESAGLGAFWL
jgi:hypothetical protein